MFWSINMEVGRLLADDGISDALHSGERGMAIGIMKRCLDYDSNYKLKRLGFNKDHVLLARFTSSLKRSSRHRMRIWRRRFVLMPVVWVLALYLGLLTSVWFGRTGIYIGVLNPVV